MVPPHRMANPLSFHQIMLKCWAADPSFRPSFASLLSLFKSLCRQPGLHLDKKGILVNKKKKVVMLDVHLL